LVQTEIQLLCANVTFTNPQAWSHEICTFFLVSSTAVATSTSFFFWEKTGIGGSESSQGSDNAVVLDDFFISTKF
jgi:hypothetical protein